MPELKLKQVSGKDSADPRWKYLYRIGAITCLIEIIIIIFSIIAYFIWPYKPGVSSTIDIFTTLQKDRLGGLISIDLLFLVANLISILLVLALYVALKRVNEKSPHRAEDT